MGAQVLEKQGWGGIEAGLQVGIRKGVLGEVTFQ